MNRTIEQALLSLLPTHNAALPQPLTDLASSLLAQSRHRASTLKAEEEIARPYACAHLACDRLKTALNLPPIDPRPPIPPRIYKRLFNHLDKILPATASTPSRGTPAGGALGSGRIRTPSSKLREQQQQQLLATSPLANKTRGTPGKDASLSQFRTASSASESASKQPSLTDTPSKKQRRTLETTSSSSAATTDALPRWLRPTLRYLTTRLDDTTNSDTAHSTTTPASKSTNSSKSKPKSSSIAPLVAAALESIITPHGRPTPDAWVHAHLSAVLGALYLFVWRTVTWPGGEDVDRERYVRMRRAVGEGLSRARGEVGLKGVRGGNGGGRKRGEDGDVDGGRGEEEEEEGWEGWEEVGVKELDAAALRGNRHGWFDMEWVRGVEDFVERERARMQQADGGEEEGEGEVAAVGQIGRPDSMFQERYDYLGERKRKAYAEWKQGMLKRIRELEAR